MDGIILINKQESMTSHDVINKMRKILGTKAIGHTGTLDPLATGVLPLLVNAGTKTSKYLVEHDKQYIAVIKFGIKTDTGDINGQVIEEREVVFDTFFDDNVKIALKTFLGKRTQIPPMYSAVKVKGKKLYEYARQGITIDRELRNIEIYNLELIIQDIGQREITVKIDCSKGTYIRTLAEEIAEKLGTIGTIKELKRTAVGEFKIENSITLEEIAKLEKNEIESKYLINIEQIFKQNRKIKIDTEGQYTLFLNGVKLKYQLEDGVYRIYDKNDIFLRFRYGLQ